MDRQAFEQAQAAVLEADHEEMLDVPLHDLVVACEATIPRVLTMALCQALAVHHCEVQLRVHLPVVQLSRA